MQRCDLKAMDVVTIAFVCEGDKTLEDLGIMELEPGQCIIKCNGIDYKTACHMEHTKSGPIFDVYRCDACGYEITEPRCDSGYSELAMNFCPWCGRRVVSE